MTNHAIADRSDRRNRRNLAINIFLCHMEFELFHQGSPLLLSSSPQIGSARWP